MDDVASKPTWGGEIARSGYIQLHVHICGAYLSEIGIAYHVRGFDDGCTQATDALLLRRDMLVGRRQLSF